MDFNNINRPDQILTTLSSLFQEAHVRFPYADCRTILSDTSDNTDGFIPDLDLYASDIVGHVSCSKKFTSWDQSKIDSLLKHCRLSFFEKHPNYKFLEIRITEHETPELFADFVRLNQMRALLLELVAFRI